MPAVPLPAKTPVQHTHGIRIMLYTECDQLGHFEACVPTPQQDLDPSATVVVCGCSSFGFPPSMRGGMRSSCAQNRTDMSPVRSCSPTSAADSSAGQTGVPYVHTPVSPDSIPAAQPSPVSSETAPKAPSDSVHPTSAADNSVGQRGVPYVRAPVSPDSIEATQPSPVSAASAPKHLQIPSRLHSLTRHPKARVLAPRHHLFMPGPSRAFGCCHMLQPGRLLALVLALTLIG